MGEPGQASDRILTIPNAVSVLRLALVPVFGWLFLGGSNDAAAFVVLAVVGGTDWVDGVLARRLGQVSRLGQVLDPIADRVAIIALLLVLLIRHLLPLPIAVAILVRDALVALGFAALASRGVERIEVSLVGKAATAAIYAGIGMVVAALVLEPDRYWRGAGIILLIVGAVLYWIAAIAYAVEASRRLRRR